MPTPEPTPEQPRDVVVRVVDAGTSEPVSSAVVDLDGAAVITESDGTVLLTAMRGTPVAVEAADHDPA
ncbi:MAG TPA: hypothetical protein VI277_00075, partial [Candidatus Limnocylindria bacterium]